MFKPKPPQTIHHFAVLGAGVGDIYELQAYEVRLQDGVLCFLDHEGKTIVWIKDWRSVREVTQGNFTAIT